MHFLREINKSELRVTLGNGAEVLFRSVDDPERARGPNLSGAWLDEASLMDAEAYSIIIACLREGGEQGWLSATFTPKGKGHWTYDVFGSQRPNSALFTARTVDNPFLPATFAETLRAQYPSQFAAGVGWRVSGPSGFGLPAGVVSRSRGCARRIVLGTILGSGGECEDNGGLHCLGCHGHGSRWDNLPA